MQIRFIFFLIAASVALTSCQTQPTLVKQEVATQDFKNRVLVDTRSAFDFAGFHISGSINLYSGDFLILKNPRTELRVLDPDIAQVIERLAKRGLSPLKSVILLNEKRDDIENKKWLWLLRQLEVRDVTLMSLQEYREQNKNIPQAKPEPAPVWNVKNVKGIQVKAGSCFVKWSESQCL